MVTATQVRERAATAIREGRKSKGLSQQSLATAVGVTQATLSNYENAKRDIPLATFIRAMQALGVEPGGIAAVIAKEGEAEW